MGTAVDPIGPLVDPTREELEVALLKIKLRIADSEAELVDARARLTDELATLAKLASAKAPDLIKRAERFLDTRSREMFEEMKADLQRQVNYLIVKNLYDAEIVGVEVLDQAARQAHTQAPVAPVNISNASDAAMGHFRNVPPPIM